jgi:hypothetical protein
MVKMPDSPHHQYRIPNVPSTHFSPLQPSNRVSFRFILTFCFQLWQLAAEQSRLHSAAVGRYLLASTAAAAAAAAVAAPPSAVSHSVSSILSSSNRLNIAANQFSHYRIGSPFQVVHPDPTFINA